MNSTPRRDRRRRPMAPRRRPARLDTRLEILECRALLAASLSIGDVAAPEGDFTLATVVGTLKPGAEADLYNFQGRAGQRLVFDSLSVSEEYAANFELIGPDDSFLGYATLGEDFVATLPDDGEYTIVVDGLSSSASVDYSFRVLRQPDPTVTPLTFGTTYAGDLGPAARTDFTFTGAVGQRIFFDSLDTDYGDAEYRLVDPDGNTIYSFYNSASSDSSQYTLTRAGAYRLVLEGAPSAPYQFRLLDLGAGAALTLGKTVNSTLSPGVEADTYTFTAVAGKSYRYDSLSASDTYGASIQVYAPGSTYSLVNGYFGSDTTFTPSSSGTYALVLAGSSDVPVDYSFKLIEAPAAVVTTKPLTFDTRYTGTVGGPDTDEFTFTGAVGQAILIDSLDTNSDGAAYSLFDPSGTNLISFFGGQDTQDFGPVVLSRAGTYRLVFRQSYSVSGDSDYAFKVLDLATSGAAATVGGAAVSGTLTTAETDVVRFSGKAGQVVVIDGLTPNLNASTTLYRASGSYVTYGSTTSFVTKLPADGNYAYLLSGYSFFSGDQAYSVRVVDVADAPAATLGATISATLDPGTRAGVYRYVSTTAGAKVALDGLTPNASSYVGTASIYSPSGVLVGNSTQLGGDLLIPSTEVGTYTLIFDGYSTAPINYSFQLGTPAVATEALTLGTTVSGTIDHFGDSDEFTFTGAVGQLIYYDGLDPSDSDSLLVRILDPGGLDILPQSVFFGTPNTADLDFGPLRLTRAGTYKVVIGGAPASPYFTSGNPTGDYKFRVLDAASATPLTLGTAVDATLAPGTEADLYRFTGKAGQVVLIDFQTYVGTTAQLVGPQGTLVTSLSFDGGSAAVALPSNGQYTLVLPGSNSNSSASISYRFVVLDGATAGTALSLGTTKTGTLDPGYKAAVFAFSGTAGQRVAFDLLSSPTSAASAILYGPDGEQVAGNDFSLSDFVADLDSDGRYLLVLDGRTASPVDYSFRLKAPADTTTALTLGKVVSGNLAAVGDVSRYTFEAAAGQRFYFDTQDTDYEYVTVHLLDPDGFDTYTLYDDGGDSGIFTVYEDGTYTLVFENDQGGPLDFRFRLLDVAAQEDLTLAPREFKFVVSLSQASTTAVKVDYATADGTATIADGDYRAASGTLTFAPGETTKTITVLVVDDTRPEADETFFVNLGNPTGGTTIADAQGKGTIQNDDTTASIAAASATEGNSLTFTVTLVRPTVETVTVSYETIDGTATRSFFGFDGDYYQTSGTLTFAPGETTKTIVVDTIDDSQTEGTETFTVRLSRPGGGATIASADAVGTILDNETANSPPVLASIGSKTVDEKKLLSFTATATDPENDPLTFSLVGAPTGATIGATDGKFRFTPTEAQGPGSYTFTVVVSDGSSTDQETITVTVNEVNDAPVLDAIGSKTAVAGQALTFTATATDPEGDPLTFSLVGAPAGASINATTGAFSYTPASAGTVSLTVKVSDGKLTDQEKITITVAPAANSAPTLAPIGSKTVDEKTLLSFTAKATDPENDPLTFSLVGAPAGAAINATTGAFTFTPTEAQGPGSFTFTVRVSDGSLTDEEAITVTVNEVNDAPTLDPIGSKTVNEKKTLSFTAKASDPEGDPLTFGLVGAPSGATINATTGAFSFTPTEAQGPGSFTFTVVVSDGSLTDEEAITVTVNEVNDAPVLDPIGSKTVEAGEALTFTATATDPENDPLTFSLVGAPAGASIDPTTGKFSFTSAAAGTFTATVRVSDGKLTDQEKITITVAPPGNSAPVLAAIGPKSVDEGQTLTFTASGTDPENDPLTFSLVGAPAGATINATTGVFTFTPSAAQGPADYAFIVRVSDGKLTDEETITVTVNDEAPTVAGPVIVDDGEVQRSMVTRLKVAFSEVVTLDAGAFDLRASGSGPVDVVVTTAVVGGKTEATLTFQGDGIIGGSLADGRYTLTIDHTKVRDDAGQALAADLVDEVFRLFGDIDGDGDVDNLDLARFGKSLNTSTGDANYFAFLDFNNDGVIDRDVDLAEILKRRGRKV